MDEFFKPRRIGEREEKLIKEQELILKDFSKLEHKLICTTEEITTHLPGEILTKTWYDILIRNKVELIESEYYSLLKWIYLTYNDFDYLIPEIKIGNFIFYEFNIISINTSRQKLSFDLNCTCSSFIMK